MNKRLSVRVKELLNCIDTIRESNKKWTLMTLKSHLSSLGFRPDYSDSFFASKKGLRLYLEEDEHSELYRINFWFNENEDTIICVNGHTKFFRDYTIWKNHWWTVV